MKSQRLRSKLLPLLLLLTLAAAAHSATRALPNPVPLINNPLVPDAVAPGSQGFTLTVNGTGFVTGSVVNWNGSPLATTFVNASQVTAVVPAVDVAVAGTASVTVVNPGPGGGRSNVSWFSIRKPFNAASFDQSFLVVGSRTDTVIATDLNNDGKPDLVTAVDGNPALIVSLGNGDGSFSSPITCPLTATAVGVVATDLNGDGIVDLAATVDAPGVELLSVLIGNGDGTFQFHQDFPMPTMRWLAAADFDGDGNTDIAVVFASDSVGILLGTGDGTFQQPVIYSLGAHSPFGIAVADFDGDGVSDLAVTESDGAVAILIGNGDGTFQSAAQYQVQGHAMAIVSADFNGDGYADVAVQSQSGWISILLNKGNGSFLPHVDYETPRTELGLASGDVNGDGKLDLIVPGYHPGRVVSVFMGKGDGTFVHRNDFPTGDGISVPATIAVADFNGDGMLDLATANQGHGTLSILSQVTAVLSRTYLKFGNVKVGEKSTRKVTLSNIGDNAFTINGVVLEGKSKDGYEVSNNCGTKLAPGTSCKITIVFTPTLPRPYRQARIKVNDSVANQKIYLTGSGVK